MQAVFSGLGCDVCPPGCAAGGGGGEARHVCTEYVGRWFARCGLRRPRSRPTVAWLGLQTGRIRQTGVDLACLEMDLMPPPPLVIATPL